MKELNLSLYKKAYLIRTAEDAIRANYAADHMKTPMHMSTGSEAICAGVIEALHAQDQILGTYRSHGIYLAKTGETDQFFAEMYGKASGMAKGKGGSMHLTSAERGFICSSAIVGTTIPVALGAAYTHKVRDTDRIAAVFFGDGAIDEGVFWESLNAACVMKLPVMFVCEDNDYAVHIPKVERHGYKSIVDVVKQFDCDIYTSKSTDAAEIHDLTKDAIEGMRGGQPAFLHLRYYRYLEHVGVNEDFNQGYRKREEYEEWLKIDPVALLRKKLAQWYSEADIKKVEQAINEQVVASVKRAEEAPFSAPEALYEDIFA